MAELKALTRGLALALVRAACACACFLPLSCAFGNADALQSLFEDNEDPLFVAVGAETVAGTPMFAIYSSSTGAVWSRNLVRAAEPGELICALYGNGLFLSAGTPSNYYISADGVLWGKGPTGGNDTIYDGTYGNGRYVVVGSNSSGQVVSYASEDGIFWIKSNLDISFTGALYGIVYGNGKFVAVGSNAVDGTSLVVSSTDGVVWTGNLRQASSVYLNDVAYGNGLFVAVGTGGGTVVSADGLIWSEVYLIRDGVNLNGITWGNGMFMAVGDPAAGFSAIYLSEDGMLWSMNVNKGAVSSSGLQDVAYCHGLYVAVDLDGKIHYSLNGLSWIEKSLPTGTALYGITCRP
jgi:hypothetical protein